MDDTRAGRMRRCLRTIAGAVFITGATLVVLEGLVSYALAFHDGAAPHAAVELERSVYDPGLGWVNRPNVRIADLFGPGHDVRINRQGFRNDRDFPAAVPEGRLRIICTGDSFTFGAGVDNDQTWCQLLESLDPRIETVNMGQTGYGVDQAYLWYRRDGSRLSHQVHLLAFITDDFYRMQSGEFLDYPKPMLDVQNGRLVPTNVPVPRHSEYFSWLVRQVRIHSRLRTVEFSKRLAVRARVMADDPVRLQEANDRKTREVLRKMLEDLRNLGQEQSVQTVLVYLPSLHELTGESPAWSHGADAWRPWMAFLTSEAQALGIPLFDILGDFWQLPAHDAVGMYIPSPQPAAGHLNERGNALAAKLIYEKLGPLLRRRELPGGPGR
jgi:hypothetical protein